MLGLKQKINIAMMILILKKRMKNIKEDKVKSLAKFKKKKFIVIQTSLTYKSQRRRNLMNSKI